MAASHKWNLHDFLANSNKGLYSKLELSSDQDNFLKSLRKLARERIKEVFNEVQDVFKSIKISPDVDTHNFLRQQIKFKKSFRHVDGNILDTLVNLVSNLNNQQRIEFLKIQPRFRTQGSFNYKTLNAPYRTPPQEMDIDDGVYFPMKMFENAPALAHKLMIALVDAALQSLAAENVGWKFDATKPTCSRLRVPSKNTHLDVPMYATPEEKFVLIKSSLESHQSTAVLSINEDFLQLREHILDKDSILLARRDRDKWQKSDPQVVQQWFKKSVDDIGEHARLACRFLKGWRDATWINGGGPSSIALMKCVIDTLGSSLLDGKDLGLVMQAVACNLPKQLNAGVVSPDDSDEKPLFPSMINQNDSQRAIVVAAQSFANNLNAAFVAGTKEEAHRILCIIFGERGTDSNCIKTILAAPVYSQPAKVSEPAIIEDTMTSG